MRSLRRAGLGLALAGLWAGSAAPMLAADNGTVDAQVTVATPCLEITNPATGSVDFGSLPFSSVGNDVTAETTMAYANCSSAGERIWMSGTDATGPGATWFLSEPPGTICSQGINRYQLFLGNTNGLFAYFGVSPRQFQTLAAGQDSGPFTLRITMPCANSDGVGQTMSFQARFTATF